MQHNFKIAKEDKLDFLKIKKISFFFNPFSFEKKENHNLWDSEISINFKYQ